MLKKILILFYISLFNLSLYSQLKISPIWCFGNKAGIDFSKSTNKSFTSSVNSAEGTAGATDENNNLVFYTDKRNSIVLIPSA